MPATYLFAPAHEDRKVRKALASAADAVILDFEDAVPEDQKAAARQDVARLVAGDVPPDGPEVWVRVNGVGTRHFQDDVRSIPWTLVQRVVVPKVETTEAIDALVAAGASRVIVQVESLAGFAALPEVASRARFIEHVCIGTWDLALDLGLPDGEDPDDADVVRHLRCDLVIQCRRLGLSAPLDGVFARLTDETGFRRSCERSRRLGFAGRFLIHPNQIATANQVFRPSPAELARATRLVEQADRASSEGRGAVRIDDQMVDRPVVERARALLARAGRERRTPGEGRG